MKQEFEECLELMRQYILAGNAQAGIGKTYCLLFGELKRQEQGEPEEERESPP